MHKHIIGSEDELEVLVQYGEDVFGYFYPETNIDYYNNEIIIGFNIHKNKESELVVSTTRLEDGSLRYPNADEPEFNPNSAYLIQFTNKERTFSKYHQFDINGNYLD